MVLKLSELNIAVNRTRLMKQQLQSMHKIIPEESDQIDKLIGALNNLEGGLIDNKRETPRDVLRHEAGLDDTLINLLWVRLFFFWGKNKIKKKDIHQNDSFIKKTRKYINYSTRRRRETTIHTLKSSSRFVLCLLYTSPSPRDS